MKSKYSTNIGAKLKFTLLFIYSKDYGRLSENPLKRKKENGKQSCFATQRTITTKA
jgi:hypothetical protein